MNNQQPNTQTSTPDKNAKTVKNVPTGAADGFTSRADLDGKNDSGPDPEIHDKKLPPQ